MKIYSYKRVSTQDQILSRQTDAINRYCQENNIKVDMEFEDKASGKTFERKQYKEMRDIIEKDDVLIIKELDRFGRNMDLIKKEWQYFMEKGVKIIVIDMPLISSDLSGKKTLDMRFISNLVFEVLCYSAEKEREKLSQRVKEGIKSAKERGTKVGRKETYTEDILNEIKYEWDNGTKIKDITEKYGISKDRLLKIRLQKGWEPRNQKKAEIVGKISDIGVY